MSYTVPQLFRGILETGPHRCFFCGGSCGEETPSGKFVKDSFTGLDTVTFSPFVCFGCVASQGEQSDIKMACGELRSAQKVRGYSWVITSESRVAATKAHREFLFDSILNPPNPPFAIVIADSGQKHLIYRSVVNWDREFFCVGLETEQIQVDRSKVAARMGLVRSVCAVVGKPVLTEKMSAHAGMMLFETLGQEVMDRWFSVRSDPLTRLMIGLCPKKEDCVNGYIASGV